MRTYLNMLPEIQISKSYQGNGFVVVKGKDKGLINRSHEELYLDLVTLAIALNTSCGRLEELISYNSSIRGDMAYYRDKEYKAIKVININSIYQLFRHLRGLEFDNELLAEKRENVIDFTYKIEKEVLYGEY